MAPMAPGVASTLMGPLLYNPPLEERERERERENFIHQSKYTTYYYYY